MSLGKIAVGAGAGFLVAGPIGAIVGAVGAAVLVPDAPAAAPPLAPPSPLLTPPLAPAPPMPVDLLDSTNPSWHPVSIDPSLLRDLPGETLGPGPGVQVLTPGGPPQPALKPLVWKGGTVPPQPPPGYYWTFPQYAPGEPVPV